MNLKTQENIMPAKEERVKETFDLELFLDGQRRTWQLVEKLKAQIKPGMTEAEAHEIYLQLQKESGAEKYWHPAKIRFGVNTLRSFREPSEPDIQLQQNDIFFIDIGPIYEGYEGDAGRTYTIGTHTAASQVIKAGEEIFHKVASRFKSERLQGAKLYQYAESLAEQAGYELVGEGAMGHRVGDFPHAVFYRGSLKDYERVPSPNRWILEIQLRDHKNKIGAFYEDILS